MKICGWGVGDICEYSVFPAFLTLSLNPEGVVPCRRTELVNEVEKITGDGISACVGSTKDAAFERRVHITVTGRCENLEGLRIEN